MNAGGENKTRTAYIATVQVMLDREAETEAAESLSEYFRGSGSLVEQYLIDWSYLRFAGVWTRPTQRIINVTDYEAKVGLMNQSRLSGSLSGARRKIVCVATLQICIGWEGLELEKGAEDAAHEAINGLLYNNSDVMDWQPLQLGGQFLPFQTVQVPVEKHYKEGDAFEAAEETQLSLFQV